MKTRPTGILIIGLFLLAAPMILLAAGISLLFPGTFLDQIWTLNQARYIELAPFRELVGTGFLALVGVILLAGIGLLNGRKWGWWLAILIFGAQIMGDGVRFLMGDFLGGSIGLVVVAALLYYLTRPKVKEVFQAN